MTSLDVLHLRAARSFGHRPCILIAKVLSIVLLDASDVSEKTASQLYLFSERRLIEYAGACRSLQRQLSILHDEKEAAVLALERERARSQQLGEEAQKLQSHLDIIRQVLRDSDLDQAKQRLAQLEWNISDWPPTSPRDRRREHSAGSLLDPGNASSSSDTGDNSESHTLHSVITIEVFFLESLAARRSFYIFGAFVQLLVPLIGEVVFRVYN
ncbi:unnamed protein product [Dibothriocephalus latus]|uniref:Uncharacterized protein n=1 Tax=Dibothriocephalus latus TaxID=60516 RepID=A0A3P7LI22_DIBLA|nr:unnamed protein product [Dibothriocephalus latus]